MEQDGVRGNNTTVQLTEDVRSNFKDKGKKDYKLYAKKGDKVQIIHRFGDVLIVQGKELFSVHKSKVYEEQKIN